MIDIKFEILEVARRRSEFEDPMNLTEIAELAEKIQNKNIEELIATHQNFKPEDKSI